MSSTAEKLVYLQNGVFKRKEMTNGLQYYSDGSFDTFSLPASNGNYVLTKGDNGLLTWTDAGTVVPEQPKSSPRSTTRTSKTATARRSPLPLVEPFHTSRPTRPSASSICRVAASTC